jgi:hypothetical protein
MERTTMDTVSQAERRLAVQDALTALARAERAVCLSEGWSFERWREHARSGIRRLMHRHGDDAVLDVLL